jgi:maltose-binding protein MalE
MRINMDAMRNHIWLPLGIMIYILITLTACDSINPPTVPTATQAAFPTATATRVPTQTPTPTEIDTQATITIWHAWDESQIPILVQIQRDFRDMYPDIHFDVLYIPVEDLFTRFEAEVRRGGGPTLLLGPAQWGPALYDGSLVENLSEQGMEDIAGGLNQPALGAARYQGALVGLPYSMHGVVLYRNKAIIPTRAETFEELVSAAQFATEGEQIGAILERSFYYAGAHLEGIGGDLMDDNALPAFNNPKGLEWLELLRAFELAGPPNYFDSRDVETFNEARVGWIIDGTWNLFELAEAVGGENLAVDPWPTYGDGQLSGYVQAENIYLSTQAKGVHRDASLQFIRHFLSVESQTYLTDIGLLPTSEEVQVVNIATGHLINQAIAALSAGTTYPVISEMDVYAIQMEISLKTYYDGAAAENVLQAAQDSILEQLAQLKPTPTPTPTPTSTPLP